MTQAKINATVTRCREKQPLIVLEGGPFNGLEIRPVELRRLAQNLAALAEMAVRMPTGGKRFSPTKIVIGEEAAQASPSENQAPLPRQPLNQEQVAWVFNEFFGNTRKGA